MYTVFQALSRTRGRSCFGPTPSSQLYPETKLPPGYRIIGTPSDRTPASHLCESRSSRTAWIRDRKSPHKLRAPIAPGRSRTNFCREVRCCGGHRSECGRFDLRWTMSAPRTRRPKSVLEDSATAAVEACCKNWRLDGILNLQLANQAEFCRYGNLSKRLPEAATIYDWACIAARGNRQEEERQRFGLMAGGGTSPRQLANQLDFGLAVRLPVWSGTPRGTTHVG